MDIYNINLRDSSNISIMQINDTLRNSQSETCSPSFLQLSGCYLFVPIDSCVCHKHTVGITTSCCLKRSQHQYLKVRQTANTFELMKLFKEGHSIYFHRAQFDECALKAITTVLSHHQQETRLDDHKNL